MFCVSLFGYKKSFWEGFLFIWARQICTKINSIKGYVNAMSRGQQDKGNTGKLLSKNWILVNQVTKFKFIKSLWNLSAGRWGEEGKSWVWVTQWSGKSAMLWKSAFKLMWNVMKGVNYSEKKAVKFDWGQEFSYIACGNANWCSHWRVWLFLKKG